MADLFQQLIQKMIDFGFYNFLFPFIISLALFYGLLKKSAIFGNSFLINAVVAVSLAFMIAGFPVIFGQPSFFALPLSTFFAQGTVILLIFVLAFIGASFFYPDMTKWLMDVFKHRTMMTILIVIAFGLLFTSGLIQVLFVGLNPPASTTGSQQGGKTPFDIIVIVAGMIIFVILIIVASSIARTGGGKD